MPAGVFWDATASHKSAEGRYIHYEWSQLTVVEKREAGLICIREGRALSRPSYVAATERGPPNESTPFVAVSIVRSRRARANLEYLDKRTQ